MALHNSLDFRRAVRTAALRFLEQNRGVHTTAVLSRVVQCDLSDQSSIVWRDLTEHERIHYRPSTDSWSYKPVTEGVRDMKTLKLHLRQKDDRGTPVRELMDAYHGVHRDLLLLIRRGKVMAIHDPNIPGHSKVDRHLPRDPTTQMLSRWGNKRWWVHRDVEPGLDENEKAYQDRVVKNRSLWHEAARMIRARVNEGIRELRLYEASQSARSSSPPPLSDGDQAERKSSSGEDSPVLNFVHSILPSGPDGTYTENDIVECLAKDRFYSVDVCPSDVLFWKHSKRFEGERELSVIDPELKQLWLEQPIPSELQLEEHLKSTRQLGQEELRQERRVEAIARGARLGKSRSPPKKRRRRKLADQSNRHLYGEKGFEFLDEESS